MRLSQLLFETLRTPPGGICAPGVQRLARAGFVRVLQGKRLVLLPLGALTISRISQVFLDALEALVPQPLLLTHLASLGEVVRATVRSYRQLPALLYASLPINGSATLRLWLIAQDASAVEAVEGALERALRTCGAQAQRATAEPGWVWLSSCGETLFARCSVCGYTCDARWATAQRRVVEAPAQPIERVATPNCPTIESLAQFLGIAPAQTAKALFLEGRDGSNNRLVFAVVRGDTSLSEAKLSAATGLSGLRPAREEAIRAIGAEPGYASPVGLPRTQDWMLVVDELVARSPNLVAGANQHGYHLLNTNYGRDYAADLVADIAAVRAGDACSQCGSSLALMEGDWLVSRRAADLGQASCPSADGVERPLLGWEWTVRLDALLAHVAETHGDEQGLILPAAIAPYAVHLVALHSKDGAVGQHADQLYAALMRQGISVLYDDRAESPGVKFNDADLIGLPVRLTIGAKTLADRGVEVKRRDSSARCIAPFDALCEGAAAWLS